MPEIISNTSPLQYLHQLGVLDVLPKLVSIVTVPPAVEDELTVGQLNLPDLQRLDWITIRRPSSSIALPLVTDLGSGEREVLALELAFADNAEVHLHCISRFYEQQPRHGDIEIF